MGEEHSSRGRQGNWREFTEPRAVQQSSMKHLKKGGGKMIVEARAQWRSILHTKLKNGRCDYEDKVKETLKDFKLWGWRWGGDYEQITILVRHRKKQTSRFNQKIKKRTIIKMWKKVRKNTVNRSALSLLTHKFPLRGYQIIFWIWRASEVAESSQSSERRNKYYEELESALLILIQDIYKIYVWYILRYCSTVTTKKDS